MIKTTKFLMIAMSVALALTVQPNTALAQELQLKENQKSVALFDIRIDHLIKDLIAAGVEQKTIDQINPFQNTLPSPSKIERVFGALCFPENLDVAIAMMAGSSPKNGFPFEFFVRFKFIDTDSLEREHDIFKKKSITVTLEDGKEYMTAKQGLQHNMIFARRVDKTTFEVGTKAYLVQPKRNFFTDRLKTAYASAPKESIRLIVDLETRRELLQQYVEWSKASPKLGVFASAYLDLIDNTKSLTVTSSMSSENLLTVIAEANSDSDAEELAEGIDALLATYKLVFARMAAQITPQAGPEMQGPLKEVKAVVDSLATIQSGSTVKLLVEKPEGFAANLAKLQQAMAVRANKMARMNNFRQLALGAHSYESVNQKLPFQIDPESDISWRVRILPYIELNAIFDEMDLDKSLSVAPNSQFAEKMPEIFGLGGSVSGVSWIKSKVKGFGDITDGSSNTVMLIENPNGGPWLKNDPLTIDEAVKLVRGLADGKELIIVLYDCSVHKVSNRVSEETLRNLFDPTDGNRVGKFWDPR